MITKPPHIVAATKYLGWGYAKGVDDDRQLIGCSKLLARAAIDIGIGTKGLDPGANPQEAVLARFIVENLRGQAHQVPALGDIALFEPSAIDGDENEAHVALVDVDSDGRLVLLHACEACGQVTNTDELTTDHPGRVNLVGFVAWPAG